MLTLEDKLFNPRNGENSLSSFSVTLQILIYYYCMISYNLVHNNLNIRFIKLEINYSTP